MHEGLIIKYYREKHNFTQQQLCKGICSVAHMSRIERGTAHYSTEITQLLSERLGVNIGQEVLKFEELKETLKQWHDTMIMQDREKTESYKQTLEHNELLERSDLAFYYQLLQVRYLLTNRELKKARRLLTQIETKKHVLGEREAQLFLHMSGAYYLFTGDYSKALEYFKQIEPDLYRNNEFYYHLAITCYRFGHYVKAYEYARTSLNYFKQANHFRKIIDAETLILLTQGGQIVQEDIEEMKKKYMNLMRSCDLFGEIEKKAILMGNLGQEYFLRSKNREANTYYSSAIDLFKQCPNPTYLTALFGYIHTSYLITDGRNQQQLNELVKEGTQLATKVGNDGDLMKFRLLTFLLKNQMDRYYSYLHESFIPYLRKSGNITLATYYEKQLFKHYLAINEGEKASEVAFSYIQGS